MRGDGRSRRIAIVPDRVLNPRPASPTCWRGLPRDGWGVVALPPGELEGEAWQAWAGPIVDQVVTFLADGYEVAICRPVGDDETDRFRAARGGWSIDRELRLP